MLSIYRFSSINLENQDLDLDFVIAFDFLKLLGHLVKVA
jgi:hypothetical protein